MPILIKKFIKKDIFFSLIAVSKSDRLIKDSDGAHIDGYLLSAVEESGEIIRLINASAVNEKPTKKQIDEFVEKSFILKLKMESSFGVKETLDSLQEQGFKPGSDLRFMK